MKPEYNYVHGAHNVICDQSGFKIKSIDARMQWDHLRVRDRDYDTRHPQDFVRGRMYNQRVSDPRTGSDIELTGVGVEVDPTTL